MNEQELIQHYDSHLEYYSVSNEMILKALKFFGMLFNYKSGWLILDLGCGDGRFSIEFTRQFCAIVIGVDYSEKRIEKARQTATLQDIFYTVFICDNIHEYIKNTTACYDLIVLFETLEHLEHPNKVIGRCKQLAPHIVASVPLNMPYIAHLQVYKDVKQVITCLQPDDTLVIDGHCFCYWRNNV